MPRSLLLLLALIVFVCFGAVPASAQWPFGAAAQPAAGDETAAEPNQGEEDSIQWLEEESAAALQETDSVVAAGDHVEFWYSEQENGNVIRERLTVDEYLARKDAELNSRWIPIYQRLLQGDNTVLAENDVNPVVAPLLTQMDDQSRQFIQYSEAYLMDVAKRMAVWAQFYEQLDYWNVFVEDKVLRESLNEDEKPTYDAATDDAQLDALHGRLLEHAALVSEQQERSYQEVVTAIESNIEQRERYHDWLDERQDSMLRFAENWQRAYNGSQVEIDGTLFLFRHISEVPDDPLEDDLRNSLPRDAVLVDIPRRKTVTPYDLIDEDGTIRRPIGQ